VEETFAWERNERNFELVSEVPVRTIFGLGELVQVLVERLVRILSGFQKRKCVRKRTFGTDNSDDGVVFITFIIGSNTLFRSGRNSLGLLFLLSCSSLRSLLVEMARERWRQLLLCFDTRSLGSNSGETLNQRLISGATVVDILGTAVRRRQFLFNINFCRRRRRVCDTDWFSDGASRVRIVHGALRFGFGDVV
jgi:hypothetical protein